jgi:hypothetical protein
LDGTCNWTAKPGYAEWWNPMPGALTGGCEPDTQIRTRGRTKILRRGAGSERRRRLFSGRIAVAMSAQDISLQRSRPTSGIDLLAFRVAGMHASGQPAPLPSSNHRESERAHMPICRSHDGKTSHRDAESARRHAHLARRKWAIKFEVARKFAHINSVASYFPSEWPPPRRLPHDA